MAKSFKFNGPYATQDEYQSAEEMRRMEQDNTEEQKFLACSWTASNGKLIEVYVWDARNISVFMNGQNESRVNGLEAISAKQQAQYAAMGIVAKLGPVGLTSERKAAIEAKINSFKK